VLINKQCYPSRLSETIYSLEKIRVPTVGGPLFLVYGSMKIEGKFDMALYFHSRTEGGLFDENKNPKFRNLKLKPI
jgi:hypothetical protein